MAIRKTIQENILKLLSRKKAVPEGELRGKSADKTEEYAVARSLRNMEESGLIEAFQGFEERFIRLTQLGKEKFYSSELSNTQFPISKTWDGKWRIIILDVPESRKSEREALRYLLKKAGFACVKNSVWISPLPFEQFFQNIKKDLKLTTEIMIIVTDTLDDETSQLFHTYKG